MSATSLCLVGVAQRAEAIDDLAQDLEDGFAIPTFVENVFSRVATRGHMIQRAVKFYSARANHDLAQEAQWWQIAKYKTCSYMLTSRSNRSRCPTYRNSNGWNDLNDWNVWNRPKLGEIVSYQIE
jgi:hypothetical protein